MNKDIFDKLTKEYWGLHKGQGGHTWQEIDTWILMRYFQGRYDLWLLALLNIQVAIVIVISVIHHVAFEKRMKGLVK